MQSPARFGLVLLAALAVPAFADIPVVYEDDHVRVRSGIEQAGSRPMHVGDVLDLVVDVEFDAGNVQVERPDDEFFERAFAANPAIRLYRPGVVTTREAGGGVAHLAVRWPIQAVACPAGAAACPGVKSYELPVLDLAYQLVGSEGTGDGRSARFRPWPATLTLTPAIAVDGHRELSLGDAVPGGAWPTPLAVPAGSTVAAWLIGLGLLILLASALQAFRRDHGHLPVVRLHHTATRWERALASLESEQLGDDQWSDLFRRAINWYCLDELGSNPCSWLGTPAPAAGGWPEFFVEALERRGVAAAERRAFLARFRQLAGLAAEDSAK